MILSEFLNLFKQGKVAAHSHMKNLMEVAMADGVYDPSEDRYLKKLAGKHGIGQKTLEKIKNEPAEVEFVMPDSDKEKFNQIYELVNMMVIDEHIDSEELRLCVILAKKLGYQTEKCEELVESIASNIRNSNTRTETRKRVEWLLK